MQPPFSAAPAPPMQDPNAPPMPGQVLPPQIAQINVEVSEHEAKQIVAMCQKLKTSFQQHSREKKLKQRNCYAYTKSKFIGNGDLLPIPSTAGSDRDLQKKRPRVFIPKTRQVVKTLHSKVKLTLFPNDEDFFRVRGKDAAAAQIEDQLTDGLKYVFKQSLLTEKMGKFILNMICMTSAAALPTIKDNLNFEYAFNPASMQYEARQVNEQPLPDLQILDPLCFYIDPKASDPERAKWLYVDTKKKQELRDSMLYINTQDTRLDRLSKKTVTDRAQDEIKIDGFTDLQTQYEEIEDVVDYDLYYLPYFKTDQREYRNMLIGIAGGELLVRFHPNLFPRGLNPAVFCTWSEDPFSPYGIGPVEDIMDLQRLINIIYNYVIELLARMGNRMAVKEGVDLDSLFGVPGGVMVCDNPQTDVNVLTGDYAEPAALMNFVGTLTAELQQVAGAQNPFQGAADVDFKKTATELQILQENAISDIREVIEHISVMGVQRILERMMYLCADLYQEPLEIRVEVPGQPVQYRQTDFSPLKSGRFVIELVNVNPSQSKQAQVQTLGEFLQLVASNPMAIPIVKPIADKIAMLEGLRDGPDMLNQVIALIQQMQQQQAVMNQQAQVAQAQKEVADSERKHQQQMEQNAAKQPPVQAS